MSISVLRVQERPRVSLGALWFGLLAGPLAWCAQMLLGYGLAARACGAGGRHPIAVAPALGVAELIVSGSAFFLTLVGLITTLLVWRRATRDGADSADPLDTGVERTRFMALSGMLVGILFLLAILMNAVGYFLVPPCG